MNEWMGICRTTTKTPLIVVPATGEHAFTARPGQTAAAAAATATAAGGARVSAAVNAGGRAR